jgi:hypothetical protein
MNLANLGAYRTEWTVKSPIAGRKRARVCFGVRSVRRLQAD